jgi:hypothetical protein
VAGGKWIPDLKPMTPVADAARHVLTVRLEVDFLTAFFRPSVRTAGGKVPV